MRRCFWSSDEGAIAPIAVLLMIGLVGFCALVLDVGTMYAHRRALQNAADAAALAGARELETQILGGAGNPSAQALLYAGKNGVPVAGAACTSDGNGSVTYNGPNSRAHSWEVTTSRRVPLTFGPVIGISSMCVSADAVAVVTTGQQAKLFPFALSADTTIPPPAKPGQPGQSCDPNAISGNPYCFILKDAAGGSTAGNFGILDFTCAGKNAKTTAYVSWAEYGYGSAQAQALNGDVETIPMNIPPGPWTVCTFTGNTSSGNSTIDDWITATLTNPPPYCPKSANDPSYQPDFRCPLVGLLPVLKSGSLGSGSSSTVQIIDFDVFEIVGLTQDQSGTGHQEIVGEFLQRAAGVGPTRMPDPNSDLSGALMIRLVQ